jgi:hypothetical protein
MDRQIQVDLETLRTVVPELERLESQWNEARLSMPAPSTLLMSLESMGQKLTPPTPISLQS